MSETKAHVIVCGSSFGALHARAAAATRCLHLAGIYAGGSQRSKDLAAAYGVPLYTSFEEIPHFNDDLPRIASVVLRSSVLGGKAQEVACRFVEGGWDILLEPPVHSEEITTLAKLARGCSSKLLIGNLYARLAAVEAFRKTSHVLIRENLVSSIDAFVSSHVVYYLVSILGSLFPGKTLKVITTDQSGPYVNLSAQWGDIPLMLHVYNQADAQASDAYSHLFFKVSVTTPDGVLQLAEICGPVTWYPRLTIQGYSKEGLPLTGSDLMPQEVLFQEDQQSYEQWISQAWTEAIAQDIMSLLRLDVQGKHLPALMLNAKNWTTATQMIGFPHLIDENPRPLITPEILKSSLA